MNFKKTIIIVVSILLSGCASQQSMYKKAVEINTVEKYEAFLQKYPDSEYQSEVKGKVIELDFTKALDTNTVEKYKEFLKKYPDSEYQSEVKKKIIELEFSSARSKNTISAFKEFLQKYPDNKYKGEAITVIDQLENELWHEAKRLNTNLSYISYLKKNPEGKYTNEANNYLKTPIYKARNQIEIFNRAFGKEVKFTDEQVRTYIEKLENETYATTISSPVTYYRVSGTRCDQKTVKTKKIIQPKEIGKSSSLKLKMGELSITPFYSSNPSIRHSLFINKRRPSMTHNGCSGPGLELKSSSRNFLRTFSIEYHSIAGSSDYVIPDLIWGADETAGYDHNGEIFHKTNDIIKIEGLKCDIGKLPKPIMNYKMALEIKTYIKMITASPAEPYVAPPTSISSSIKKITASPAGPYVAPPTSISSSNAKYSSAITLKAPDIAENGCVVPVTISAPSLSARQISIYSGSRSNLAMRSDLVGASTATFTSTRIKMSETSPIIVDILTNDGKLLTSRKTVNVTIGCRPTSGSGGGRPSIKLRGKKGTLKLLLSQPMFTNDHLDTLSISADGRSMVNVKVTAWVSKNPYFSFKTTNRTSRFSVTARSTSGQSASGSTN